VGSQRWQAAFELSNIVKSDPKRAATPEFINGLMDVYKASLDEDIRARQYIALILGELKEKRAVGLLTTNLQRSEKLKTADWSQPGFYQYLRPSLDQIRDELIQNEIYTLWALGSIGDNSAVPAVLEFVKNQEPSVRKVAIYVLGVLKDQRAAEDLRVALNDSSDDIRWNAALALAQLNAPDGAELLTKLLDRSYVDSLQGMTADQKTELTVNAVTALGMLKHEPAKAKIQALGASDPVPSVRSAAMEALKKF